MRRRALLSGTTGASHLGNVFFRRWLNGGGRHRFLVSYRHGEAVTKEDAFGYQHSQQGARRYDQPERLYAERVAPKTVSHVLFEDQFKLLVVLRASVV